MTKIYELLLICSLILEKNFKYFCVWTWGRRNWRFNYLTAEKQTVVAVVKCITAVLTKILTIPATLYVVSSHFDIHVDWIWFYGVHDNWKSKSLCWSRCSYFFLWNEHNAVNWTTRPTIYYSYSVDVPSVSTQGYN